MADQQEEEVTYIREVYAGRCRVEQDGGLTKITLQPKNMDVTIKFILKRNYPAEPPKISVRAECLDEDENQQLGLLLDNNSRSYLNQPMIERLLCDAETWLKENGLGKSRKSGKPQKRKKRARKPREDKPADEKLASMKTADDVVKRIQWDSNLPQEDFLVGYQDRFLGIKEKYFTAFSWEDLATVDYNVLAIPKHRIEYFKYKGVKIWDKLSRLDNVFGSLGSGKKITDIIDNYEEEVNAAKEAEVQDSCTTPEVDGQVSREPLATADTMIHTGDSDSDSDSDDDGIVVNIGTSAITSNPLTSHTEYWRDKLRPNYFLAVRVTNPKILEVTKEIQDDIVSHQPLYNECCIPPSSLHITLRVLGLDTREQVDSCCRVLESVRDELEDLVPVEPLVLDGVANFYNRVVYAKVKSPRGFADFVDHLSICLRHEGIEIRDQHEFVPHMTLVKTSRPVSRRLGTANIDRRLYERFEHTYFGEVKVTGVYLCSMGDERQVDGFYISPAHIEFRIH